MILSGLFVIVQDTEGLTQRYLGSNKSVWKLGDQVTAIIK